MKMKLDPRTGRTYAKDYFTPATVLILLMVAAVEDVSPETIAGWTPEQLQDAGDWALRVHLRASDNLNRVPPRPPHVPDFRTPNHSECGTVMDL